jgi:hypothetical protein
MQKIEPRGTNMRWIVATIGSMLVFFGVAFFVSGILLVFNPHPATPVLVIGQLIAIYGLAFAAAASSFRASLIRGRNVKK